MNDEDLQKLFRDMDVPVPDSERKKETLNLAGMAFEAQKSANSKNNVKTAQGLGWLSRLTLQNNSERKDDMNTNNKKLAYGLLCGVAVLAIALPVAYQQMQSTIGEGASVEAPAVQKIEFEMAEGSPVTAREEIREQNLTNLDSAVQQGGSAVPMPAAPPMASMAEPEMAKRAAPGFIGGAVANLVAPMDAYAPVMDVEGRDNFSHDEQNSVIQVKAEPVSTFSIDVDTASYAFVRQSLDNGVLPQKDAVRVEEMINYFDYAYPGPKSAEEPFATNVVVKPSPWNEGKQLISIGIKGFDVEKLAQPDSNLVFLLDTSGSMDEPKKLPLLKQSLSMLLDTLKPTDKVSIVVYAGSAGTVLQPTEVSKKGDILNALNNLSAGGSTAGGEGIRMAYDLAKANFNEKAVNRVILATDGDFNVGITDPDELQGFVEREREKGIFLSVLGFGTGNYNDALMQKLAQNGNGVAAYIDTLNEARKVLVQEAGATLFPIAKDVKIQVEFNPDTVAEYRLVGYETRALKTEDFNNDKVDAGDIGAGAEVTAIYEIATVDGARTVDESRYAKPDVTSHEKQSELAFVKVRYKLPKESTSKLITTPVLADQKTEDAVVLRETNWAEAVAGFAQLLKGGTYTGKLTWDDVLKQANANKGDDPFGYRAEFINLIHKAKTAASLPAQNTGGGPGEYYR